MAEKIDDGGGGEASACVQESHQSVVGNVAGSRIERRKAAKKEKRKLKRKELAAKEREEEEARLKDPEQQRRIQLEEDRENERLERERRAFEEHERAFLEALTAKSKAEEERDEMRKALEDESKQNQREHSEDDWEYIEEGPPEIIWQGNEIIVKKKKVRVKRKDVDQQIKKEDPNRPTSNPLPPHSEVFADYKNRFAVSAQQLLDNVAQQTPNFGTEQDKAHCPFHLKTGACRFGSRCSRVHFYPDKSCTLLIKNMYSGPGLVWEQDEGLEYMDEEVERSYEEFYEDVQTEFLKFGEIINFKVCKNGSSHLRGNVYIHYKSLDSAVVAYQSINGRYFAGKRVTCEFIGVTKWKVAICGEYMKSKLKTCSRGTACNFIHCFRNPEGDYEWADMDRPPPKYWVTKMAALFGYSGEYEYDNRVEQGRSSSNMRTAGPDSYYRRSLSRERDFSRRRYKEYDAQSSMHIDWHQSGCRNPIELDGKIREGMSYKNSRESKNKNHDSDSDRDRPYKDRGEDRHQSNMSENIRNRIKVFESQDFRVDKDKRDRHHVSTGESSRHHKKMMSPHNTRDKRDRTSDSDCKEEDKNRHHKQMRKQSWKSSERLGLGSIDEHNRNSLGKSKDENKRKESDSAKVEPRKAKKQCKSNRGDRSSLEPSETNASAEGLKSGRYHETTSFGHGNITKLCENIDEVGHTELSGRFPTRHLTSFRDPFSYESSYETKSRHPDSWRSKSHDYGYYSKEDIDKQSRGESDKLDLEKHRAFERKTNSGGDLSRYKGNSNSQDQNSDQC